MKTRLLTISLAFAVWSVPSLAAEKRANDGDGGTAKSAARSYPVLWKEPVDLNTRNLIYGSGGESGVPRAPFTFVKEDRDGSNPKMVVKDAKGHSWKVKMGAEAQSEGHPREHG